MRRKLRIVVLIASAIACGLLVPLWAGSYRQGSVLQGVIFSERLQITSELGRVDVMVFPNKQSRNFPSSSWSLSNYNAIEMSYYVRNDSTWGFHSLLPNGKVIRFPHWFLVVVFGTIGIALRIKWPIRFSLRTMMIVTAIAAISLSTILGLASAHRKGYGVQQIHLKQSRIQYTIAGPARTDLRQLRTADWFGFGWQGTWGTLIITVPVWFVVLCSAALAAIAWLRWREWLGVRTLSIATAIGVVELGLIAWAIR